MGIDAKVEEYERHSKALTESVASMIEFINSNCEKLNVGMITTDVYSMMYRQHESIILSNLYECYKHLKSELHLMKSLAAITGATGSEDKKHKKINDRIKSIEEHLSILDNTTLLITQLNMPITEADA